MKHQLTREHKQFLGSLGLASIPDEIEIDEREYRDHYDEWQKTLPDADHATLHVKTLAHAAWAAAASGAAAGVVGGAAETAKEPTRPEQSKSKVHDIRWELRVVIAVLILILAAIVFTRPAHAQFSRINSITAQNQGTGIGFFTYPFTINCSTNMSCSVTGSTFTLTSSATAGTAWSGLTAPTLNLSMAHGANTTTFTWGAATGAGVNLFNLTDTLNNTGTGFLWTISTASGSSLLPFRITAQGTANGIQMSTAGLLSAIGTGGINATQYKGGSASGVGACGANTWASTLIDAAAPTCTQPGFSNVSGTAVVSQGGTGLTTIAANQLIAGRGTSAPASIPVGNTGQVLISNGAGSDPSFQDPLITYNQALLFNAVSATATQTSAATTLSTRTAIGTINVIGSGITGAPAGCSLAYSLSLGGVTGSAVQTLSLTPGNNYQGLQTTPTAANVAADQMVATYSCTTYPTAGTLTVSFSPINAVVLRDALPTGANTIGGVNLAQYTPVAGRLPVDGSGVTQPISAASLPLPTGASQEHTTAANPHAARLSDGAAFYDATKTGQLPAALVGGRLDVNVGASLPAGTNVVGALSANQSVNAAQVAGTATSVNGGNIDAGTIRVAPARDSDVCNPVNASQVAVSVAASGSTELVALTAGQTIYICDAVLIAAGTVNVKLVYGTGVACATGPTDMTGAVQLVAQTGWSNSPTGRLKTAAANALCINLSAAINVQGFITYRKAATF